MPWVGRLCICYIVLVKVLQGRPRISTFIISDNSLRACTEYVWPRTYTQYDTLSNLVCGLVPWMHNSCRKMIGPCRLYSLRVGPLCINLFLF